AGIGGASVAVRAAAPPVAEEVREVAHAEVTRWDEARAATAVPSLEPAPVLASEPFAEAPKPRRSLAPESNNHRTRGTGNGEQGTGNEPEPQAEPVLSPPPAPRDQAAPEPEA